MEPVAPVLEALMGLRRGLCAGRSLRVVLKELPLHVQGSFARELSLWSLNSSMACPKELEKTSLRHELRMVLESGLAGEPILARLEELESEALFIVRDDIERYLQKLPLLALMPLLLLLFPAFLLLMLGPLLKELLERI